MVNQLIPKFATILDITQVSLPKNKEKDKETYEIKCREMLSK